jgi:hypothetical protein
VPTITAAILYGDSLGLDPLVAVNVIHVIERRVFVTAEAQRALVLRDGHAIWPAELTTTACAWSGRRRGSDEVTTVRWTLDDARRAKLDGKPNWRAYPRAMLSARASADLVRYIFADVVLGIGAIEEYAGEATDLGVVAEPAGNPPARPRATRRRRGGAAAVAAERPSAGTEARPVEPLPLPPLPGESEPERAVVEEPGGVVELLTAGQLRRIQQLFRERGIATQAERRAVEVEIVGHDLRSTKELTTAEGDRVITYLEWLGTPDDEPPTADDEPPTNDVTASGAGTI